MSLMLIDVDSGMYNFDYFQQDNVCRFCWKREAYTQLVEITSAIDDETGKSDLITKITECLNIDITRSDHLKKICVQCLEHIKKFHNFKRFCQETDRKLREIFSNPESLNIKTENDQGGVKDEYFDEFFDCLKNSDAESEFVENKISKSKTNKKSKRTATYCNICRLDFVDTDKFNSHNLEQHGIVNGGEFKCFGCEKLFKNRKSRLGHEVKFCKSLKDGYKCCICNRFLPRRGMYETHIRDHRLKPTVNLPEKIFKCNKCSLLFKSKQLLNEHIFEHKGDTKKYVCERCGRVFTRNDYLQKHKLTHTGIKQHVCPHCNFQATQRSSLVVHIRTHTGERPYQCSMCPQQCVSSSNLRAHQQRHLGIKMHECTICNKKFGYRVSLQEHMSTHAPAQTHTCEQCAASYSRLRALKRHVAAKHGDNTAVK